MNAKCGLQAICKQRLKIARILS